MPDAAHFLLPDGQIKVILYSNKQYAQALHRNYKPLWEMLHWWDMRLANRFIPAWNAGFDTYSSQPDGTAGLDTYIQNNAATTNNDGDTRLFVGEFNSAASVLRTLIKFDFSTITPPVVTSSVIFSLWVDTDVSSNARDFKIYRQKRDWVENQATWNIWKTSNNWSTAGGFHSDDCEQTEISSRSMTATETGEKQWTSWTTTLLDEMINGAFTNNGFLIKADTEVDDGYAFRSSDHATAGERPKLVINYTRGSGDFLVFF